MVRPMVRPCVLMDGHESTRPDGSGSAEHVTKFSPFERPLGIWQALFCVWRKKAIAMGWTTQYTVKSREVCQYLSGDSRRDQWVPNRGSHQERECHASGHDTVTVKTDHLRPALTSAKEDKA
ncbi:hypothetical protein RRG08_046019 [Elysia crispata]|uniref:Uncharacterized protein n=1 Tax=Elysia crispata TaxID=231223 RepID=A0AAE1DEQ5_9GAST|nr:hypothetical protein RRG08_046019 [Elysia crispata]